EGPAIEGPLRSEDALARVHGFEPREALGYVLEAIGLIQKELGGRVPLIGFAGAPFTLASYAIEGGHSNNFAHTKSLMYGAPAAWHRFCDLLAGIVSDYLVAQIEAGVDAVQVFDSWVGALNAPDYREFILPHTRRIFDTLPAYDVLARAGGRNGHVFNLGHGILPTTPLEHVQALARYVHQKTRQ